MPVTRMNGHGNRQMRESSRGRTASPYSLGERREKAYEMFMKGRSNKEVAEALTVDPDTASRYRKEYEDRIEVIARNNPGMLLEVIQNTIRALEEIDHIRSTAWREYEEGANGGTQECPDCGSEVPGPAVGPQTRNQFLKTVLQAQEQRHKLFGLFGVKQEFFQLVQQVQDLQNRLLDFMQRELCANDRSKLEAYLSDLRGPTAAPMVTIPALPQESEL